MLSRGRFGTFGGPMSRNLMPALEQLEAAFVERRTTLRSTPRARGTAHQKCGPDAAHLVSQTSPTAPGRLYLKREDFSTEARTRPTRCSAGTARQAHGQDQVDRRNRGRPAWRRNAMSAPCSASRPASIWCA